MTTSASAGTSRHARAASNRRGRSHATGSWTSSARWPAARSAVTSPSMRSSAPPRAKGTWAPQTKTSMDKRVSYAEAPTSWSTALPRTVDESLVRVNAPQTFFRGFWPAVRDIWSFRELLVNLVRKELKVKYKDSALGFLWSLARPLFLLMVYWIIFGKFLKAGIPNFAFYLFAGLVAWDLFGSTLGAATVSITGNGGLIKKIYFPREILPLASIGAGLVHFALQLVVLFSVLLAFRFDFFGPNLLLLPLAFVALVMFMTAMSLFLAAANVYLRDIQHLLEVFLLFWFWMTPIVYPINTALNAMDKHRVLGVKL